MQVCIECPMIHETHMDSDMTVQTDVMLSKIRLAFYIGGNMKDSKRFEENEKIYIRFGTLLEAAV